MIILCFIIIDAYLKRKWREIHIYIYFLNSEELNYLYVFYVLEMEREDTYLHIFYVLKFFKKLHIYIYYNN